MGRGARYAMVLPCLPVEFAISRQRYGHWWGRPIEVRRLSRTALIRGCWWGEGKKKKKKKNGEALLAAVLNSPTYVAA